MAQLLYGYATKPRTSALGIRPADLGIPSISYVSTPPSSHLRFPSSWKASLQAGSPLAITTTCQHSSTCRKALPTAHQNAIPTIDESAPPVEYNDTSSMRDAPDIWKLETIRSLTTATSQVTQDVKTINSWIEAIRENLRSMLADGGVINESAYDTAWVARVPSLLGEQQPEFPQALQWVLENQDDDGSWGDRGCFLLYDKVCCTLGCILALQTWDVGSEKILRGIDFIWKHIGKISEEDKEHMPVGFELVFPAMLEDAKQMDLNLPYTAPFVRIVTENMKKKLQKIPLDLLHLQPTTMLQSLEGIRNLVDWPKVLHFQHEDGSLLGSPASTAVALMHTGDKKCHEYLSSLLKKFKNAVPMTYPIEIFHHLWVVDTLERLGIAHHFKNEISDVLDFIHRHWSDGKGLGWTKNACLQDIDDTSMAFRILRLHDYKVSSGAFRQFQRDGEFSCFAGQTNQGISDMLTLYRASQVAFPNEVLLKDGGEFAVKFLKDKLAENKVLADKWSVKKDLPGEVTYALQYPYHKSLPLLEIRSYIEKYGADDAWIAKVLYRLPLVNNPMYLDLAKAEYNAHQSFFREEIENILSWYEATGFASLPNIRHRPVEVYYTRATTTYEAEFSALRVYSTRCSILVLVIDDLFDNHPSISDLHVFLQSVIRWDIDLLSALPEELKVGFMALYNEVNDFIQLVSDTQQKDVSTYIRQLWERLINAEFVEAEATSHKRILASEEYRRAGVISIGMEVVIMTTVLACGLPVNDFTLSQLDLRGKAMQHISYSSRVLNDIATYRYERGVGKCNSISCYLNENSDATEEMAIAYFQAEADQLREQINLEVMELAVPKTFKRILFSVYQSINHFYDSGKDATSANTDLKHFVSQTLFEPII